MHQNQNIIRYRVSVSGLSKFVRRCSLIVFVCFSILLRVVEIKINKINKINKSLIYFKYKSVHPKIAGSLNIIRYYSSLSNICKLSRSEELKKVTYEIESLKNNLDISHINSEEFQEFVCGLFQAEGTSGAYFPKKDSLRVVFNLSIGQIYSKEAAISFLTLQAFLCIGNIKVEYAPSGKVYIRYVITNTLDIIEKAIPYFKFVYGKKRHVLVSLVKIYELSVKINNTYASGENNLLVPELIHLVYSINLDGQARKISLQEKLSFFNCLEFTANLEVVPENINLPSKFFIIGLYLGDGSQGFVFDERKDRGVGVFYIKPFFNFVTQKASEDNIYLYTIVAKSLNIKPSIHKSGTMVVLGYNGKFVFDTILPFLSEHSD